MKSLSYFLFLSFLAFFVACGDDRPGSENRTSDLTSENVGPEYGAVEGTEAYPGQQRRKEQLRVEGELEAFSDRLDALKVEAEELEDQAKAEMKELIQELEKNIAVAEKRLDELGAASADTWQEAKAKTAAAVKELEESYNRAVSRLRDFT